MRPNRPSNHVVSGRSCTTVWCFVCHVRPRMPTCATAIRISAPAPSRATKPRRVKVRLPVKAVLQEGKATRSVFYFLLSTSYFVSFRGLRIVLLGVAMVQSGCWEGITRQTLATILSVEGPAAISRNVRGQFDPLQSGAHPGAGNVIETSASSRVAVALLPNILFQLGPNSRLEIVRLALTKDGNETGDGMRGRYAEVKLLAGRMFVSQVWGEATVRFTVATPHGELVTTSNALYCLESDEQKTRVTCISGTVGFRPSESATATRVPAGFLGEWPSQASSVVAAQTEARGQDDLQEALEVEQKLHGLMSKKP